MADKKRILIVEDEVMIEEVLKARLEFEGFDVIAAENGKDGLLKAISDKPDLILADLMLPGMDGNHMIRVIRSNSDLKGIPIIAVSARGGYDDIEKTMADGANDYIVKPFSAADLVKRVQKYL